MGRQRELCRIGFNERALATAMLRLAVEDAEQSPWGMDLDRRVPGDRERMIEVIGEAQWFLLDDHDVDVVGSFLWCCDVLDLEDSYIRRVARQRLLAQRVLLPRRERIRLAEIAGLRRMGAYARDRVMGHYRKQPPAARFREKRYAE